MNNKHIERKLGVDSNIKVAKVVATTFAPRSVREGTTLLGDPLGFFSHSQKFTNFREISDLLKYIINKECSIDPGMNTDLIIINNDNGNERGRKIINDLNGVNLPRGRVITDSRENIGFSYGAYNYAVKNWINEYDFFIFTEDDIIISEDHYSLIAVNEFLKVDECGFLAFQSVSFAVPELPLLDSYHAHGGVGITSKEVLQKIIKRNGEMSYYKGRDQNYRNIILNGEVKFTNDFIKSGFKLLPIHRGIKLYSYAYDDMRGIGKSRYANIYQIASYKLKKKSFKILKRIINMFSK
jgi:hypothetical protein